MKRLTDAGCEQLAAAYATGDLSPVEVTQAALDRVDAWEPKINAMFLVHREAALAAARDSERRWKRGAGRGWDHGKVSGMRVKSRRTLSPRLAHPLPAPLSLSGVR